MKTLSALLATFLQSGRHRSNFQVLLKLLGFLGGIILLYTLGFHALMAREGQEHSWLTGFYWVMVSMSTLGFGDITFQSDLGRMFSVLVLVTGTVFMLILLPFTFIQFFYAPWLEARDAARAPRALPAETSGHVLLTAFEAVDEALVRRLQQFGTPYFVLVADVAEALALHDRGVPVMVGALDDPETYRRARVDRATLVVATRGDSINTNVAFTVQEVAPQTPVVALASSEAAVDILKLAGCRDVIQLGDELGRAMARRVLGRDGAAHPIGQVGSLVIAEAAVGEPLAGRTLREARLRDETAVNVAGIWERGQYRAARADTRLAEGAVLLLAGDRDALESWNRLFARPMPRSALVVVIGYGRVGRAVVRELEAQGIDYRILDLKPIAGLDPSRVVTGDASDLRVLDQARIRDATTLVITTHQDDLNVYLTLYCRKLDKDLQIISRATVERNVSTLHRAGADVVLWYASMGAHAIFNVLRHGELLLVAEGLNVFRVPVPPALAGRSLAESGFRQKTGANVLAVILEGRTATNPDITVPLAAGAELVLIGDRETEDKFFRMMA